MQPQHERPIAATGVLGVFGLDEAVALIEPDRGLEIGCRFEDDAIEAALLPISNDRVLMGSSTDVTIPLDLKSAIASTSLEYFISGVDSSTNRSLQPAIGRSSALLTDAEMLAIIDEGLERS